MIETDKKLAAVVSGAMRWDDLITQHPMIAYRAAINMIKHSARIRTPEHRLLLAILDRAIQDLAAAMGKIMRDRWADKKPAHKLQDWLRGRICEQVCGMLDLDHEMVIESIRDAGLMRNFAGD